MQDQKWSDKKQTKIFLRDLDKFIGIKHNQKNQSIIITIFQNFRYSTKQF